MHFCMQYLIEYEFECNKLNRFKMDGGKYFYISHSSRFRTITYEHNVKTACNEVHKLKHVLYKDEVYI